MLFLAYTVVAMHANFILCLFPSSASEQHPSTRTCSQSFGLCLRRIFRRFCICLVITLWAFSFTATIPLLYSIDSNEKSLKPVYCPGTTQINYLDELFDRNRFIQTILFDLIPLLLNLLLAFIALLRLFYDILSYLYIRCRMSKCSSCCRKNSSIEQNQLSPMHDSVSFLSSLSTIAKSNMQYGINLTPIIETTTTTPDNEIIVTTSNVAMQSCGQWLSKSFVRSLLVLSTCLLACIYPITMRFYLIYFSVLVPLIFAILNYSFVQLTSTQQQTNVENYTTSGTVRPATLSIDTNDSMTRTHEPRIFIKSPSPDSSNEQFELKSALIKPSSNELNESITSTPTSDNQQNQPIVGGKQKYFSNRLYEDTRTTFT